MTMEPVRLRDLDGDAVLREDLSRAAKDDVGYDVAAGAARFEAGLAAGLPLPADPASASSGVLAWLGIGAGVVGVAAIVWAVGRAPTEEALRGNAIVVEAAPEESPVIERVERAPIVIPPPPPVAAPAIAPIDPPVTTPRKVEPKKPAVAVPPRAADDDRLRREMDATDAAKRALASDPARALELAQAADRDFEGGMFAEDRDGIAAVAKLALGKGDAAARRYLSAHPKGSYAQRIRKALEDQGE